MNAVVRPIRLVGRHALAAIEARVKAALEREAAGWLQPPMRSVALRIRTPGPCHAHAHAGRGEAPDPDGHPPRQGADAHSVGDGTLSPASHPFERFDGAMGTLWIRCRPADRRAWLRASLGEAFCTADDAPVDAWAAAVAQQGWEARNAALCEALTGPGPTLPAQGPDEAVYAFGSGAVQIEAATLGLFALADGGVLRHVPPRPLAAGRAGPPRVPLARAAARGEVRLDLSVGRVEIALRTLLELRPGDVLRLPTRLDDTLALGPPSAPPLRCALGERAGRAAVLICPTDRKSA